MARIYREHTGCSTIFPTSNGRTSAAASRASTSTPAPTFKQATNRQYPPTASAALITMNGPPTRRIRSLLTETSIVRRFEDRQAARILAAIAIAEAGWVFVNGTGRWMRLWQYVGFTTARSVPLVGWAVALVVAGLYVWYVTTLPSVRQHLTRPSLLKLLGLAVAAVSGLCEEAIFRKLLMDDLGRQGFSVALQALASAVAFGAAHAVWGLFRGSLRAASGAMTATGILGVLLAIVYVVSGRNLAPCVVAHFTINALIEPGLVVAAVRGEMGRAA